MTVDPILSLILIWMIYLFNTIVINLTNTEWIGFGLFFVWSLCSNIFLLSVAKIDYFVLAIATLLFVSLFIIVLSLNLLYQQYSKKSEPIQNFPKRREAFTNYKIIYIFCQFLLLCLFSWSILKEQSIHLENPDKVIVGFSVIIFLSIWMGLQQYRTDTDIVPFLWAFFSGLSITGILGGLYYKSFPVIMLGVQSGLTLSAYLVYLSNWIHRHSLHVIN